MEQVKGVLKVSSIPSVNRMYIHTKDGRVKRTKELVNFRSEVMSGLSLFEKNQVTVKKTPLELHLGFYFNHGYWKRDYDNAIKPTQDAIASYYGFNDALIVRGVQYKAMIKNVEEKFEYVYFLLKAYEHDIDSLALE